MKANHLRLISLSNLCKNVQVCSQGRFFRQSVQGNRGDDSAIHYCQIMGAPDFSRRDDITMLHMLCVKIAFGLQVSRCD